ncbi:MAG: GMC family oxidoreductase [Proteobacteria bacterium]|nr:GMC family oxidoreductase [Pseudomonadota bacterium]HQR03467.1 GMC family oxidoreductase [Rhodocyclaceae bacterium]
MSRRNVYDVCVIGTGAGGGIMIDELTHAGMSVVALERGPLLGPDDFMGHDELSNIFRGTGFAPRLKETVRHSVHEEATEQRFSSLAQVVGGSAVHWGAWSWRYRPDEFKVLRREGPVAGANLADWPVDAEEMAPWYARAEAAWGVAGASVHNALQPGLRYPNPPHPYRTASFVLEAAARRLGHHPFPVPMAINSRPHAGRATCMNSGMCTMFGCPVHAKASPLSVNIPRALATGRLDLRPESRVFDLAVDTTGRIREARCLDAQGRERTVRARQFVLAGGSLGTAQLLLLSRSARFPQGLANGSDQVGRNLMFHTLALTNFIHEQPSRGALGPPGMVAFDDLHDSNAKRGFIRGAVMGESPTATPLGMAMQAAAYFGEQQGLWGQRLKDFMRLFPHVHGLISIGEDLPVAENRVDLDPVHVDDLGIPVHRITHRYHENDQRLRDWYKQRMVEVAEAAGAQKIWTSDWNSGTGHIMGTCRMGDDPATSVVDRWCRSHEVSNLWITDGSVFPTSGGYNPTLTIVANAYRVASRFIAEAKRLNLG